MKRVNITNPTAMITAKTQNKMRKASSAGIKLYKAAGRTEATSNPMRAKASRHADIRVRWPGSSRQKPPIILKLIVTMLKPVVAKIIERVNQIAVGMESCGP